MITLVVTLSLVGFLLYKLTSDKKSKGDFKISIDYSLLSGLVL